MGTEAGNQNHLSGEIFQETKVAANCDVCGKGPGFGHKISHSHRRTNRRWNPNIQKVRTMVGGSPKRLNVCASCLKAGKVTRAV
ncbi:MAG: large subunit ribosomal protein L28 [Actinomycetes bacterium]